MQCTKHLVRRMHGGSLWLDKEYPIHVDDIQGLTELSATWNEISTPFQAGAKQAKKEGDNDYYRKYNTKQGGRGAKIDLINKENIRFTCYIIAGKVMLNFSRNECTLDIISVMKHCSDRVSLNWTTFLLNELFEACKDVYRRRTNIIFKYFIMTLAMWKWCPPTQRDLAEITDEQSLALRYTPWRTSKDPSSKEINKATFSD